MWLSKVIAKSGSEDNAMTGITTIGGDNAAVQTDVELRNTVLYSPGGYFWRPKAGQNVLVIKSGDKEVCVSGVRQENFPDDFGRDDICIMTSGGTAIYVKDNGQIVLTGNVEVEGSLKVNGTAIE